MKGVYILLININKQIKQTIGLLGQLTFDKGTYAYVGSAQNSLEKRLARHKKKRKKKFWHIDYLLSNKNVEITNIFYKNAKKPEECRIARLLAKEHSFVSDFGSSDCSCKSHLFLVNNEKVITSLGVKEI